MKAALPGLVIGLGGAVALLGTALVVRWSRHAESPPVRQPDAPLVQGAAQPGSRVRERLHELRAALALANTPPRPATSDRIPAAGPETVSQVTPLADAARPESKSGAKPTPLTATAPLDAFAKDLPMLAKIALHDTDPERRLMAVSLLSASESPQVIPVLVQVLSDQDEDVRMAAVESLADFTGEAPVDAIESALNDSSADIRYEALSVLADIGGERARRALENALNDPDPDVRGLAAGVLDLEQLYEPTPAASR